MSKQTSISITDPPRGHGTMRALADRTGLSYRSLFRLRERGVFEPSVRRNPRVVFYHLAQCERAIERYYKTGDIIWNGE